MFVSGWCIAAVLSASVRSKRRLGCRVTWSDFHWFLRGPFRQCRDKSWLFGWRLSAIYFLPLIVYSTFYTQIFQQLREISLLPLPKLCSLVQKTPCTVAKLIIFTQEGAQYWMYSLYFVNTLLPASYRNSENRFIFVKLAAVWQMALTILLLGY
jgi:hypothetical protein